MPIRKEIEVLTKDLRKGDTVKKWPNGRTDLLGAVVKHRDYGDVWHRVVFEDVQLPPTKRFRASDWWTVWRTELTEIEKADKALEQLDLRMLRAQEAAGQKMVWSHEKIVKRGPFETNFISSDIQEYMACAAGWRVWEEIVALWETRNKRKADGYPRVIEDPFPDADWKIGHAAWYWCTRERKKILSNRMEIRQSWSNQLEQHWRNLQVHADYEAATNEFHSIWRFASDWKEAWDTVCKAEETKYASEGHSPAGDPEADR